MRRSVKGRRICPVAAIPCGVRYRKVPLSPGGTRPALDFAWSPAKAEAQPPPHSTPGAPAGETEIFAQCSLKGKGQGKADVYKGQAQRLGDLSTAGFNWWRSYLNSDAGDFRAPLELTRPVSLGEEEGLSRQDDSGGRGGRKQFAATLSTFIRFVVRAGPSKQSQKAVSQPGKGPFSFLLKA